MSGIGENDFIDTQQSTAIMSPDYMIQPIDLNLMISDQGQLNATNMPEITDIEVDFC